MTPGVSCLQIFSCWRKKIHSCSQFMKTQPRIECQGCKQWVFAAHFSLRLIFLLLSYIIFLCVDILTQWWGLVTVCSSSCREIKKEQRKTPLVKLKGKCESHQLGVCSHKMLLHTECVVCRKARAGRKEQSSWKWRSWLDEGSVKLVSFCYWLVTPYGDYQKLSVYCI